MGTKRAAITRIGAVEGKHVTGWGFDCLGTVPLIAIDSNGEILVAGYSIEELGLIANLGYNPEAMEDGDNG